MRLNMKLYMRLVNEIPGIQERYHKYRDHLSGWKRITAWGYLLNLNVRYHVLHDKSLEQPLFFQPDDEKKLVEGSESDTSYMMSPQEFAKQLRTYDVVSFDVFDTLLLRSFSKPSDLFYLLADRLDYMDLQRIRIEMEEKARGRKQQTEGHREITFEEIWSLMEEETGIPADIGMNVELETEMECCFANPYFQQVMKELVKHNKKIIIASDMYLHGEQIRELLLHAGYPEFSAYYVSCDYGKSKSDGGLYQILQERYGTEQKFVHIGDNTYSDKKRAEEAGFKSILYHNVNLTGNRYRSEDMSVITGSRYRGIVNAHLHNGCDSYSPTYEFGFVYGGLFVTGYCQFIHEYVTTHNINKLLFLARDGDILKQAYEQLYPQDTEKCVYVLWSRLAATKLTAGYYKYDYFRKFLYHKVNQDYSLKQIFHAMELNDMLPGYMHWNETAFSGKKTEETVLTRKEADLVKTYLNENWETVLEHYKEQQENARTYYAPVFQGCQHVAAVDVGWAGSGAMALDHMVNKVWNWNCKVTGLLAGTNSIYNAEPNCSEAQFFSGKLVSYLYSQQLNRNLWKQHNPGKGHNVIVEALLASQNPSFRGFYGQDTERMFSRKTEDIDAAEVQRGVLDFVKLYQKHCGADAIISGADSMAPILLLYHNPAFMKQVLNEGEFQMNLD